jgi:hypothetical protein
MRLWDLMISSWRAFSLKEFLKIWSFSYRHVKLGYSKLRNRPHRNTLLAKVSTTLLASPCNSFAVCGMHKSKRDTKLLQKEPCKGAETDSRAKFSRETIVGVYRRLK